MMSANRAEETSDTEQVTNRIFTLANVISFIRLLMVPAYLVLLLNGYDIIATILFAAAAMTDFRRPDRSTNPHGVPSSVSCSTPRSIASS